MLTRSLAFVVAYHAGFIAACRASFVVARDRADPRVRLFLPIKNNLGAEAPGLSYTLESGLLRWRDGVVSLTADEAISTTSDVSSREEPTKVEECVEWLKAYLAGGAMRSELVFERAQSAGFSRRTVERAKGPAEVVIRRVGGGPGSFNTWEIPDMTLF